MRLLLALSLSIGMSGCRTTKEEDERTFAGGRESKDVVAGVKAGPDRPDPGRGVPLPSPFPSPDPVEKGAFHVMCAAQSQLPPMQALTVKALLKATHQQTCTAGENWLRDTRNKRLMIDSEELVELQTLTLLQNYRHIADVFLKTAKGIERTCPLGTGQTCHFIKSDLE